MASTPLFDSDFLATIEKLVGQYLTFDELRNVIDSAGQEALYNALTGATRETVIQAARDQAAKLITRVSEETKLRIADIIATGLEEQLGHVATARMIRDSIGLDSNREKSLAKFRAESTLTGDKLEAAVERERKALINDRAKFIAAQEMGQAVESATWQDGVDGGDTHKDWLTVGDSHVRDSHLENEAQGPIPIDETFDDGSMYPGDPNGDSFGCRCTMVTFRDTGAGELQQAQDRMSALADGHKQRREEEALRNELR
jgi:hypothetical protein